MNMKPQTDLERHLARIVGTAHHLLNVPMESLEEEQGRTYFYSSNHADDARTAALALSDAHFAAFADLPPAEMPWDRLRREHREMRRALEDLSNMQDPRLIVDMAAKVLRSMGSRV